MFRDQFERRADDEVLNDRKHRSDGAERAHPRERRRYPPYVMLVVCVIEHWLGII
jgi:hypothetical protein